MTRSEAVDSHWPVTHDDEPLFIFRQMPNCQRISIYPNVPNTYLALYLQCWRSVTLDREAQENQPISRSVPQSSKLPSLSEMIHRRQSPNIGQDIYRRRVLRQGYRKPFFRKIKFI